MLAIPPSCLYYIEGFAIDDRRPHGDRDDERPQGHRPGPFRVLNDSIGYWSSVYKACKLVAALDAVLQASGVCGKASVAIDFFVEAP